MKFLSTCQEKMMWNTLHPYLALPGEITTFEHQYLKRLNRVGVVFFCLHLPLFMLIAWLNDTGPTTAAVLTGLTLLGPLLAQRTLSNPRHVSMVYGFTAMCMGGLLVHFGQGPMQIEMHFYFFSMLAVLAMYANPAVILTAAVTVTLHHLIIWVVLPQSIFNYDASFWVVLVHATFVVLESVAACFISRNFFDNVIGLEKIVAQRTEALNARNDDMRRLLDSVGQGFLTLDRAGRVSAERSAVVETWLGPIAPQETFAEALGRQDAAQGEWFLLGWEEVVDGCMPVELSLTQLPARLTARSGHHLQLEYTPLTDAAGELKRVMVVISDRTAELDRERLEAQQRETMVVFEKILSDKAGFLEFFAEAEELVAAITGQRFASAAVARRWIHTLKGNAAIFGLLSFSEECHHLEDALDERGGAPDTAQCAALAGSWGEVRSHLRRLLGERTDNTNIALDDEAYESILRAVLDQRPHPEIARMIAAWKLEPTAVRLERIAAQAHALAARLNKPELRIEIEDHDMRLDPSAWSEFWSTFIHVVRNAIDHGIESPDDRVSLGKDRSGLLALDTRIENETFIIEVADDGGGINWEAIRARAVTLGLPAESHDDLVEALFADGVSSREEVSDLSGRGVGMGAIRQVCEDHGGRIEVHTTPGRGTSFRFCFPAAVTVPPLPVAA